jgi:uncharacterized protein YjiS (DUF1127 family)
MKLARSFNEWRRYRSISDDLNRLSSRELEDMGFTRGDIPAVARKAAAL